LRGYEVSAGQENPAFYETQRYITAVKSARDLSLP
jgi:hypothetical protein